LVGEQIEAAKALPFPLEVVGQPNFDILDVVDHVSHLFVDILAIAGVID